MASRKRSKKKITIKQPVTLKSAAPSQDLDLIFYWTTMLVLVLTNLFAAIAIIPFMLLAPSFNFYLMVALIALFFGYVFNMLVTRIENIDTHHHLFAILFIPIFALTNLIIISISIGTVASIIGIEATKDPVLISLFYIIFFLTPHAINLVRSKLQI